MTINTIKKVLIANRGEIACRIIRTCKRLGLETVVVASPIDQHAPMVRLGDTVRLLRGNEAKDSYLDIPQLVAIARQCGVDAVHPGYGFLSENAEFAEALSEAGIKFIGPHPAAIRAMGSKSEAKAIAEQVSAPTIPGYRGENQAIECLMEEAQKIGYPLLIKATHGGGGKGMRQVDGPEEFAAALASCQREANAAFANANVMLEKLVEEPRHIEVQVFGDMHGHVIALSERDCSIQRRHQKIIEEAPAAGLSETLKNEIAATAVRIAKAVSYAGAGTVEFLVDKHQNFFFLEMNTRLQVEHPVTEMILGLDLVEWQLKVADGQVLPLSQDQIVRQGHAVEARLYAEDPAQDFLPSIGKLTRFSPPSDLEGTRCDVGYVEGNEVSVYYDPMLAKVITWAATRKAALQKLHQALVAFDIQGVKTNKTFLLELIARPEVNDQYPDVAYLDRCLHVPAALSPEAHVMLAMGLLLQRRPQGTSPWALSDGWRLGGQIGEILEYRHQGDIYAATIKQQQENYVVSVLEQTFKVSVHGHEHRCLSLMIDGNLYTADVLTAGVDQSHLFIQGRAYQAELQDLDHTESYGQEVTGQLNAPMPGRVISVLATAGEEVLEGSPILILEAMKMEHTIRSPYAGVLEQVFYNTGDFVTEGVQLAKVKAA